MNRLPKVKNKIMKKCGFSPVDEFAGCFLFEECWIGIVMCEYGFRKVKAHMSDRFLHFYTEGSNIKLWLDSKTFKELSYKEGVEAFVEDLKDRVYTVIGQAYGNETEVYSAEDIEENHTLN